MYQPDYRSQYQPNYRTPIAHQYRYRVLHLPARVPVLVVDWHPVSIPILTRPCPYSYPYPNTSTYSGYPAESAVGAAGGLSFEISPPEAEVYVDGQYIGMVGQFTPSEPPLALAPGRHHVEIRAPGFEVIAFDVDILPGQVIPYRGELRTI